MLVGENLFFSIPIQRRAMTALDALNQLCTTMGLNGVGSDVSGSFCQRIPKSGEVFHAQTYKRPKKSCSNVVQFCLPSSENDLRYGEIHKFLCIPALSVAFVKPFTEVVTHICKNAINSTSACLLWCEGTILGFSKASGLFLWKSSASVIMYLFSS